MSPRPRPDILRINPYTPGVAALPGLNRVVKLSSNEGAFGPPPGVAEALAAVATKLHRYPDGNAATLRQAIGERFSLNPDQIVCGAGSDDLIYLLCHIYGGPLAASPAAASPNPQATWPLEAAPHGGPPATSPVRPAPEARHLANGLAPRPVPARPAPAPEIGRPREAAHAGPLTVGLARPELDLEAGLSPEADGHGDPLTPAWPTPDTEASPPSEAGAHGGPLTAASARPAPDSEAGPLPEATPHGGPLTAAPAKASPDAEPGQPPEAAAAELIMTAHGFSIYEIAGRLAGCHVVKTPERDLTADVDAILAAVTPATRMVFLANPNNPTGTFVTTAETRRLRENLPAHVLLVLDAAYAEYVDRPDYDPGTALVDAGNNTVMTRTFSKMFGLGGLRLGWAYAPPGIAGLLNRVRAPFNVSLAAHEAGLAALAAPGWVEQSRAHNTAERARLTQALHDAGIPITPSEANFVLADLRTPDRAEAADAHLRAHGLIVRRVGGYGLPAYLRITVALAEENDLLIDALTAFAAAQP